MKKAVVSNLALFSAALIWGSSFVVLHSAIDVLPVHFALAIRFTVGTVLLSLIFYKRLKKIDKSYLISGGIIGVILFLAYSTQTIGLKGTTPAINAILTAVYCVIVPFLLWIIDKKRPDIVDVAAAFLCLLGIGLITISGESLSEFSVGVPDLITLVGGFFFAAHMVAISKTAYNKDPIVITILQFAVAALLSWLTWCVSEPHNIAWNNNVIIEILYLAVFATTIAMLLQNIGQKYSKPTTASLILCLEAVFGAIFSIIAGQEHLAFRICAGFVIIFLTVLASQTKIFWRKNK